MRLDIFVVLYLILMCAASCTPRGSPAPPGQFKAFGGEQPVISDLHFSSDGALLISAGGDKVVIWNVSTEAPWAVFSERGRSFSACGFSREEKSLFGADYQGQFTLWDISTREQLLQAQTHAHGLVGALLLRDRNCLMIGSGEGRISMWDITNKAAA